MAHVPLGPMPTTRFGRFKFYRRRALRRLERAHRRIPTITGVYTALGEAPTGRAVDLAGYTKQMARSYPLRPVVWVPQLPPNFWRVKPDREVFGVPLETNAWWWLPVYHRNRPRHAQRHYTTRRVKSIPRLKHLGRLPWRHSILAVLDHNHYPSQYPTYPSGQVNPWYVPTL